MMRPPLFPPEPQAKRHRYTDDFDYTAMRQTGRQSGPPWRRGDARPRTDLWADPSPRAHKTIAASVPIRIRAGVVIAPFAVGVAAGYFLPRSSVTVEAIAALSTFAIIAAAFLWAAARST